MSLLNLLRREAEARHLLTPEEELDAAAVFRLVRDMPYQRAGDRQPETTLREWRGTCSGKHYLLQALFAELDIPADIIACSVTLDLDPETLVSPLQKTLAPTNGRFVDIHNYLILHTPEGEMIVDATWPRPTKAIGMTVNEEFILGQDQEIAYPVQKTWRVPEDEDPQAFKEALLEEEFSPTELAARDNFIQTLSALLSDA